MDKLKNSLKRLSKVYADFDIRKIEYQPLKNMINTADAIEKDYMRNVVGAYSADDIKNILKKIREGKTLSKGDEKAIPFVMVAEECTKDDFALCLRSLNLSKEIILKRLIFVYFMHYMQIDDFKKQLICNIVVMKLSQEGYEPAGKLMHKMKHYLKVIFSDQSPRNISRMIDKWNIDKIKDELNLPEVLHSSELIKESIRVFFEENYFVLRKLEVLKEVYKHKNEFSQIFPNIADNYIKAINKSTDYRLPEIKNSCIGIFYDVLGDPRIGRLSVKWNSVSDDSRNIFLSWLAEKDLNLFFKIIERTAVDSMWASRKHFWSHYLKYITNTWVLFGKNAMVYARQIDSSNMAYGQLKGGAADHSVFAFQIGQYMFVEWSHNGKLRVWDVDDAPKIFGKNLINKLDITASRNYPSQEWSHHGNKNNYWQNEVSSWIYRNCGIS